MHDETDTFAIKFSDEYEATQKIDLIKFFYSYNHNDLTIDQIIEGVEKVLNYVRGDAQPNAPHLTVEA